MGNARFRGDTDASGRRVDVASLAAAALGLCPLPVVATEGGEHVVRLADPAFCRLCGRADAALVGHPVRDALPGCAGEGGLAPLLDRVLATGEAEDAVEVVFIGGAGNPVRWPVSVWPIAGQQGSPVGLVVQVASSPAVLPLQPGDGDAAAGIRELNEALLISSIHQHELADAAAQAAADLRESHEQSRDTAVLEERNRIAGEIHDTLAQAFTGILLQLRVAQRVAAQRPEEAWRLIEEVGELAKEGLAQARRSVWALQPNDPQYGDVAGALARAIERAASGSPAVVELHVTGEARALPPDIGVDLVRIGQEALANALRHARAQLIWVELTFEPDRVLLRVQDDGRGFDALQEGSGFGLMGMGQRAERLGGKLTIASQPGRGTEVAVSVLLRSAGERPDDP